MIKERIFGLINDLNKLDQESDTIILIDWSSRSVLLSQKVGNYIMTENLWILLKNDRDKGRLLDVISSKKLKIIKSLLLKVVNNFETYQVVPDKLGFEIIQFAEILYKGNEKNLWVLDSKVNLTTNWVVRTFLPIVSKEFRILKKNVLSSKFD